MPAPTISAIRAQLIASLPDSLGTVASVTSGPDSYTSLHIVHDVPAAVETALMTLIGAFRTAVAEQEPGILAQVDAVLVNLGAEEPLPGP